MSDSKKIIFEAKRTHQIERRIIFEAKRHIRQKENYFRSVANILDRKNIFFESKRTPQLEIIFKAKRICPSVRKSFSKRSKHITYIERKLFSKQSEHISSKENYFRSKANTFNNKKIIFEAKRTPSTVSKLFLKRSKHVRQ